MGNGHILTPQKCHTVKMGKSRNTPCGVYKMDGRIIDAVKEEKDLRIIIQDTLTPEKHMY